MRHLIILLSLALGAAFLAPAASATKPVFIGPSPTPDFIVPDSCAFPVLVHILVNNEVTKVFSDGSSLTTGSLKVQVTNLTSGKSEDINASGPGSITPNLDGTATLKGEGLTLFFPSPGFLGPGSPGEFVLLSGPFIINFGVNGFPTSVQTGHVLQDVCAALS
jgi:hypothetical protein